MAKPQPNSETISKAILSMQSVTKSYGAQAILKDISLTLHEGDRVGLIGRNGSGKSTLLKLLVGLEEVDEGLITRAQELRVAMLGQHNEYDEGETVGKILESSTYEVRKLLEEYHGLTHEIAEMPSGSPETNALAERIEELHHSLDLAGAWNVEQDIKKITVALNLPAGGRKVGSLSGGELRRLALAAALIKHPDLLLLDEPTNHIDSSSVEWIEQFLASYSGTCIIVTHDRYFLDRVASRIVEIDFGKLYAFPGNYGEFLEKKTAFDEHEERAESNKNRLLRKELAWLRAGAKARTTKQKARIQRYDELAGQGPLRKHKEMSFEIPVTERLGKDVVRAHLAARVIDEKVLFTDFSFIIRKGMRIGILGPNGCGKTTLLRMLMGQDKPNAGKVKIGDSVRFLYLDQKQDVIDPSKTILEHVSNGATHWDVGEKRIFVSGYLERFLFDRASVRMPMSNLSGGERNRINLAKRLLQGGNVLVLDEPTNDLDLPTLRILEDAIEVFDGCVLIVSHDRYFLNRLCTDILVFEEDGKIVHIAGNYDNYLLYREHHDLMKKNAAARTAKTKQSQNLGPKPKNRKLTWKENNELENIDSEIAETEQKIGNLESLINSPGFYERDYEEAQETLNALEEAKSRLEGLFSRWVELEDIKSLSEGSDK